MGSTDVVRPLVTKYPPVDLHQADALGKNFEKCEGATFVRDRCEQIGSSLAGQLLEQVVHPSAVRAAQAPDLDRRHEDEGLGTFTDFPLANLELDGQARVAIGFGQFSKRRAVIALAVASIV
jgi:hypothetical protein